MANRIVRFVRDRQAEFAIVLTALAIVLVLGSNLIDLRDSQVALQKALDQQQTALANNANVEAQLEALATGTQALAAGGNANAQRIVDTLKQNGISINTRRAGR